MNMQLPASFNDFNANQNYEITSSGRTLPVLLNSVSSIRQALTNNTVDPNTQNIANAAMLNFFGGLANQAQNGIAYDIAVAGANIRQNPEGSLAERLGWLARDLDGKGVPANHVGNPNAISQPTSTEIAVLLAYLDQMDGKSLVSGNNANVTNLDLDQATGTISYHLLTQRGNSDSLRLLGPLDGVITAETLNTIANAPLHQLHEIAKEAKSWYAGLGDAIAHTNRNEIAYPDGLPGASAE
jgi:hypothetical protein